MNIKLFGYEIRVEIAIACILIGMFMGLIMFCDCFEYSIIEGMTPSPSATAHSTATGAAPSATAAAATTDMKKNGNKTKEGFTNLSNNDLITDDSYTMGWVQTAKRYASGMGNENRLNTYKDHVGTPVPLPEGELFFFADNKFTPECCPSTYSDSMGCACLSQAQVDYLNQRGGNRTLGPTEF
jgi:hypothetical protein